jgi:hypothetical protein
MPRVVTPGSQRAFSLCIVNPMLCPRFSLRTLFVLVTIIGVAAGWVAYQLNWIREWHKLIADFGESSEPWHYCLHPAEVPLPLWIFGEHGAIVVYAPNSKAQEAHRLFPEAEVDVFPDAEIGLASRHFNATYIPPDHK